ncbi:protein phosphatase methylesterase-1 [Salvia divinorum]|uniref:Protein phosphatase methylesterase-1 n=1 Tax=Salvia divinorum TaxID=28513 RepID=A0ABD1FQ02_SALDI
MVSEIFLASLVPKLLLLAGTDRLDKTPTIGQMQGKFQMVVVRNTGHAIQEDAPQEFANLILNFISHSWCRDSRTCLPSQPKVEH